MIRKANIADLPALKNIYNQAINARFCTGDLDCFTKEERLAWFELHNNKKTPIFVYEMDDIILAYSYISAYRPGRLAFEGIGEISYYVDFNYHGKGIGSKLVEHMLSEAPKLGYKHLLAILLDCNVSSIFLLEKHGFARWGKLPDIANIESKICSHLYYGLTFN
jgi:phosphinothricin acetyltransferase